MGNWQHNLCKEWDEVWKDLQEHPLVPLVFFAGTAILGSFILFCQGGNTNISDTAIFVAAATAGFFAYRRAKAVERGMKDTDKSRANERFARSCAMLESKAGESVQIGGLISLDNLARVRVSEYRENVFDIACAFVRGRDNSRVRQRAIDMFLKQRQTDDYFFYNGLAADLREADFNDVDIKGSFLDNANLDKAIIWKSNLENVKSFRGATLPPNVYNDLGNDKCLELQLKKGGS